MFHELITNWLPTDPKVLEAMLVTGYIYQPYIPLVVSQLFTSTPFVAANKDKNGTSQEKKTP
jgi:hypothetical protein